MSQPCDAMSQRYGVLKQNALKNASREGWNMLPCITKLWLCSPGFSNSREERSPHNLSWSQWCLLKNA